MDLVPIPASLWRIGATAIVQRVMGGERRLSIKVTKVAYVAAAELKAATSDTRVRLAANSCPLAKLASHIASIRNKRTEIALAAPRAVTAPKAIIEKAMGRLNYLYPSFEFDTETVLAW